jgi:SET and MYND domain-containing protein
LRLAAPARSAYSPKELSLLDQLESHIDEIRDKNTASWERITLSAMAVKHYSGTDMELEEILELSAKVSRIASVWSEVVLTLSARGQFL